MSTVLEQAPLARRQQAKAIVLKGVMQAPVTPLHDDFSVDYEGLAKMVEFHVRNGAPAIAWPHHKAESPNLTMAERKRGAEVLIGRCYEDEGAPPLWPWVQIFRGFVRARDTVLLDSVLGAEAREVAQLVPEIDAPAPGAAPPEWDDPASARFRLFDAIATNWILLAFFYGNGVLAAAFYGPQSRIMDGVLGRANCLLIMTLWTAFKFVMVPLSLLLARYYPPEQFAVVFGLIWLSYITTDAFAEIFGSLFGKQTIKVWGVGDVNRKSVVGVVAGFSGALAVNLALVGANGLFIGPWIALAFVIALSNCLVELYSPRGTDDFTMATTNALLCVAFGAWVI